MYSSSAEEGSFEIRRKDKEARRRKKQKKKKKKKIGITGIFFIIELLSRWPHIVVTVFAYLLSSFFAQQMVCVCVLSPDTFSLPTCSMEVFHKN